MQVFTTSMTQRYLVNATPAGKVDAGEVFRVETLNGFGRHFANVSEFEATMRDPRKGEWHHALTGPVAVRGVHPDASLCVHIHSIRPRDVVQCLSTSTGILCGSYAGRQCQIFRHEGGGVVEMHGSVRVRARPSVGAVATTDEVPRSGGRCTANGGNMDVPLAAPASRVYVPVNHPDALLVVGDVHFRQGAGEIPGMAYEADAEVELSVDVVDKIPYPVIETASEIAVVGWGPGAVERAVRNAIEFLGRQAAFAGWSEARRYQFLGGFDLMPGNLTGRVKTFAVIMPKQAVLDPATGASVFELPRSAVGSAEVRADHAALLDSLVPRYPDLELLQRGDSRELRRVPGRDDLVVSLLLDQVYSIDQRGPVLATGAGEVRARINARLSETLRAAGVRTSTLATRPPYVLMRRHRVAERIEVVVKAAVRGSPKYRYPGLCAEPTRGGTPLGESAHHAPYVRFDWRVPSPGEDQLMPRALADHFIDTEAAERTALRAFHALREHLRALGLDLHDGCFFLDEAGEVVCGEVSPDNLASIEYTGRDPAELDSFRRRGKSEIVQTWRVIDALLTGSTAAESAS